MQQYVCEPLDLKVIMFKALTSSHHYYYYYFCEDVYLSLCLSH